MSLSLHRLRREYPQADFQTRPLACPDGVQRLLTLDTWYWNKLAFLLEHDTWSLERITAFCFDLARRSREEEGLDFEDEFQQLLMYYIYRNYRGYVKVRDTLANDAWEDCSG